MSPERFDRAAAEAAARYWMDKLMRLCSNGINVPRPLGEPITGCCTICEAVLAHRAALARAEGERDAHKVTRAGWKRESQKLLDDLVQRAQERDEARERAERAEAVIAQHDLCHKLHGKVDARAFADGCAAEQRKLYGCAPDADRVRELEGRI